MSDVEDEVELGEILREILQQLKELNKKMDTLIQSSTGRPGVMASEIPPLENLKEPLDVVTLLSLPDHLRRTAIALAQLGKATADDIAKKTKRARAVESAYLNQLVRLGYVKKRREGKTVYFSVE